MAQIYKSVFSKEKSLGIIFVLCQNGASLKNSFKEM